MSLCSFVVNISYPGPGLTCAFVHALWDVALHLGSRHTTGLQSLARILAHHGHGSKPCPICKDQCSDTCLIDQILDTHTSSRTVSPLSTDDLLCHIVDHNITIVYKLRKIYCSISCRVCPRAPYDNPAPLIFAKKWRPKCLRVLNSWLERILAITYRLLLITSRALWRKISTLWSGRPKIFSAPSRWSCCWSLSKRRVAATTCH